MATIVTDELRIAQLGAPTHSVIDFNTDNMDVSLLDETDSGAITTSTVDYAELNAADVVATADIASATVGVVGVGIFDAADTVFSSVTGDAADWLALWKNSGSPATSPVAIGWDSATTGIPVVPNSGNITAQWAGGGILTI